MYTKQINITKIVTVLNTALLFSLLFLFTPKASAVYPCGPGFHYSKYSGCIANYVAPVVWGTTVLPVGHSSGVYGYTDVYHPDTVNGAYVGGAHYNWGGGNYYHRNCGGGAYFHR